MILFFVTETREVNSLMYHLVEITKVRKCELYRNKTINASISFRNRRITTSDLILELRIPEIRQYGFMHASLNILKDQEKMTDLL